MNTTLRQIFKFTFVAVLLVFTAILISRSVDIQGLSHQSADKPWFGTAEHQYEPKEAQTPEKLLASRINWSIVIFSLLMIFVLANVFDIGKYTSRITGKETVNQNNVNKWLMLVFMILGLGSAIWEYVNHGKLIMLNDSSSEHGAIYDSMFSITLIITSIVFFITQFFLFWFSFRYAAKENHKALYYAHNNRLEIFWTIIPAIVLTVLVLRGHQTWRSIVYAEDHHKGFIKKIEIFAYQFGWKARYPGADGVLGNVDYKFISGKNELGLAYQPEVDSLVVELKHAIEADKNAIRNLPAALEQLKEDYSRANGIKDYAEMKSVQDEIDAINSGDRLDELEASIKRKTKQVDRIEVIKRNHFASTFTSAAIDDIIVQEIHLAKDSLVTFHFRSKDIIHSAWLPNFRTQMNVVPGMPTKFTFKPTKSTAEAKKEFGPDFEYYLYCNKICGASHFNMKIKVVIESQREVDAWLAQQQPAFIKKPIPVEMQSDSMTLQRDTTHKMALR